MAEMDIYMRRRLVALGSLVGFFIIFVLLVKSCGGDEDEPAVVPQTTGTSGASGAQGALLSLEEYIAQADAICQPANNSVGELDPAATDATQLEYEITRDELQSLETLELAERDPSVDRFLADLGAVVQALKAKAQAVKSGDVAAQDAAQLEIDTAEVEARASGERAGFESCGQFLDAGQGAASGGRNGGESAAVPPADTGAVTPPADTGTVAPPADTGTVAPPADTGTVTPPADTGTDTGGGGITP